MLRRRHWRVTTVALLLVLAVPGVPIARTYTLTCERCSSSCPMHAKAKKKLRCHQGAERPATSCDRTPGIALPGCGFSGEMPLVSLQPAIPTVLTITDVLQTTPAPAPSHEAMQGRAAGPPETPPPIASA
jgi:hypothetical protein